MTDGLGKVGRSERDQAMENETLMRCVRALAAKPDMVEFRWQSSIGSDVLTVFCHGSDVAKIVGRGGKTLNALVRLGRALRAPNRFAISEVCAVLAEESEDCPFTYEQTVDLFRDVCRAAFRRNVDVTVHEENQWVATVVGELSRRNAADIATAIIDLFEAVGLTIGLRGNNRLRVQINAA
mgnify:CR=1 FL=1